MPKVRAFRARSAAPRFRSATHPGIMLLEEFLKPWGMSLRQASKRMKITLPYLKLLVSGKRSVSMRMAGILERLTKMPKEAWISLQRAYDLSVSPKRHMGGTLDVKSLATKGMVRFKAPASRPASKMKPKFSVQIPEGISHGMGDIRASIGRGIASEMRLRRPLSFYEKQAKRRGLQTLIQPVEIPPS